MRTYLYLCSMIVFPQAKINLGLNVVELRPDGYHNLETVFCEVPLHDALEVLPMDDRFPSAADCDLKVTGICIEGDERNNLVVRAYNMLKAEHPELPRVHVHLYKDIPSQAGMGGGSSDGAAMLKLLNTLFNLGYTREELISKAARLGADCPFFIQGGAAYGEGIGELLQPVSLHLNGWYLGVVRPPIPVSTKEAFALVTPCRPALCCRAIVNDDVETWRDRLTNDFEKSVFAQYPEIGAIKERLYSLGAVYSSMSGSGSAVFGLFRQPVELTPHFPHMFVKMVRL